MGFAVKIIPQCTSDIDGYYAGKIDYYKNECVVVPRHTDDIALAKVYKYRKGAENAVTKILKESSYVTECEIEEV
ncbi:hypothetical protein [Niallia sp. NCCP-28]|uniref:hypothetical protein n=1 Tax=Niallia sp. NCCP-28 TaxID=2934712 RepID=UPI00207EDF29|nr:hypothetical protein [Niallia sp. NCCP-28]GKU81221.1 hypothetical protein NCCP28_06170 [Niallia sp. NCCP-28]